MKEERSLHASVSGVCRHIPIFVHWVYLSLDLLFEFFLEYLRGRFCIEWIPCSDHTFFDSRLSWGV